MEVLSSPSSTDTGQSRNPESSSVILPPHSDRMVWAILCTIFCCLVGGIVAIVYSADSNKLYSSAMFATDDSLKQSLYMQSEQKNSVAKTWIIVSLATGVLYVLAIIGLVAAGVLAEYL